MSIVTDGMVEKAHTAINNARHEPHYIGREAIRAALNAVAADIAAAEREACAKIADARGWGKNRNRNVCDYDQGAYDMADELSRAIRNRRTP